MQFLKTEKNLYIYFFIKNLDPALTNKDPNHSLYIYFWKENVSFTIVETVDSKYHVKVNKTRYCLAHFPVSLWRRPLSQAIVTSGQSGGKVNTTSQSYKEKKLQITKVPTKTEKIA